MNKDLRRMTFSALFAALIMLATMFLRIPGATGYYHLGDGLIYACAVLFGPAMGGMSAAVGSALADWLSGYAVWAPWTFVIKGLAAVAIGFLASRRSPPLIHVLAMVAGAAITVIGYGLATYVMYGAPAVIPETYGNLAQTGVGIVVGMLLVWWKRIPLDDLSLEQ